MQNKAEGAQRFFAPDMGGALKKLTDAFGADALLLSSRRVGKGVEVIGMPPAHDVAQQQVARQQVDTLAAALHSERRMAERRRMGDERRHLAERRGQARVQAAAEARGGANVAAQAAAKRENAAQRETSSSEALRSEASRSTQQPGAAQRQQFGDTLARLSSEHARLLDPLAQADSSPVTGIRRAASAIAARLSELGGERHDEVAGSQSSNAGIQTHASVANDFAVQRGDNGNVDTATNDIQAELRALRAMLQESLTAPRDAPLMPTPERYLVQHRLAAMGLSEAICKALIDSVDSSAGDVGALWSACRERLAALLPLLERDPFAGGGLFALVGPAGAGKSSLLAALLARTVAGREHDNTAVFYVEGARDTRIAELAGLAGIPCTALRAGESLQAQLAATASRRTVFIDTPANLKEMTGRWRNEAEELQLRELLVLPATGERRYLRDALQRYRSSRTLACALTFFQRAKGIGEVLSLLLSERLPLALVASDALLPEYLVRPDADFLLQCLGFASSCPDDAGLLAPIVTEQPDEQVTG